MAFLEFICIEDEKEYQWQTLAVELGTNGFVEYHPGNTNLILSIPHGGRWKPSFIKDRCRHDPSSEDESEKPEKNEGDPEVRNNSFVVCADKNTMVLGMVFVEEFVRLTGKQPHIIFTKLHRIKVDVNRSVEYGTSKGDVMSETAHEEYHNFIREASKAIDGRGLLLDLHGQNHKQNSIELGYCIPKNDLNSGQFSKQDSSVRSLIENSGVSLEEILCGEMSLGSLIEQAGYWAVPSPRQNTPGEQKYYSGGYISQSHGSKHSGEIDSIQVEVPGEIRVGNDELRNNFARDLARVVEQFHTHFYVDPAKN